mmetsp:Transcript_121994/g.306959  ORF Transcript_121994/g.306959 Transcript_121994/m.306959 type:complete len:300 (-) Transcript_121994:1331-2230(-)
MRPRLWRRTWRCGSVTLMTKSTRRSSKKRWRGKCPRSRRRLRSCPMLQRCCRAVTSAQRGPARRMPPSLTARWGHLWRQHRSAAQRHWQNWAGCSWSLRRSSVRRRRRPCGRRRPRTPTSCEAWRLANDTATFSPTVARSNSRRHLPRKQPRVAQREVLRTPYSSPSRNWPRPLFARRCRTPLLHGTSGLQGAPCRLLPSRPTAFAARRPPSSFWLGYKVWRSVPVLKRSLRSSCRRATANASTCICYMSWKHDGRCHRAGQATRRSKSVCCWSPRPFRGCSWATCLRSPRFCSRVCRR